MCGCRCWHIETCLPGLSCAAGMMHVLWLMNGQILEGYERRGAKMIPRQGEFLAAMGGTQ